MSWYSLFRPCTLVVVLLETQAVSGQVRGTIVDESGRRLPFVTISTVPGERLADPSGDGPGYWTLTDLQGHFIVPDTLIPRDSIWIATLGYGMVKRAVRPGDTLLQVLRAHVETHRTIARVGLTERPTAYVRDERSGWTVDESVMVGRQYELIVSTAGTRCGEFGSTLMEQIGNTTLIAVSVIRGEDVCTLNFVERQVTLPMTFDEPGVAEIRVVGRWNDISLRFQVLR